MKLFQRLLVAPAALGLLAPLAANATEVNLNDISNYSSEEVEIDSNSFKNQTTINPLNPYQASFLVNSGIFGFTRNPMYLGMLLILMSISFKFNILGGILICILFKIYITRFQIMPEEEAMEKIFGKDFVEYKKKVRRWI